MAASVAALVPAAGLEGSFARPPHLPAAGWLAVLFMGLASGLGYYLWLWALAHTTATRVTVFLALSPLTAALLGVLLLSERPTAGLLVGVLCVGAGLVLALRPVPAER